MGKDYTVPVSVGVEPAGSIPSADSPTLLYLRDLNICSFWYPPGSWNQCGVDSGGQLYLVLHVTGGPFTVNSSLRPPLEAAPRIKSDVTDTNVP